MDALALVVAWTVWAQLGGAAPATDRYGRPMSGTTAAPATALPAAPATTTSPFPSAPGAAAPLTSMPTAPGTLAPQGFGAQPGYSTAPATGVASPLAPRGSLGSPPPSTAPTATLGAPAATTPVEAPSPATQQAEAAWQALVLPRRDAQWAGRELTLLEAVGAAGDSTARAETVRAYWRLARSVARYHAALDESQRLAALRPQTAAATGTRTAAPSQPTLDLYLVGVAGRIEEARAQLAEDQYRLVEAARLGERGDLPWPADWPHVGVYRTHFEQVYGQRAAPATAAIHHRTFPLRQATVERRAAAVLAADDAVIALVEAHARREIDIDTVAEAIRESTRQREAFAAAVVDYNLAISEYALPLAHEGMPPETIVGMLVKPRTIGAQPAPTTPQPGTPRPIASGARVRPAGFDEPLPAESGTPTLAAPLEAPSPQPTPAAGADLYFNAPPSTGEPTPAEPPRTLELPPNMRSLPRIAPDASTRLPSEPAPSFPLAPPFEPSAAPTSAPAAPPSAQPEPFFRGSAAPPLEPPPRLVRRQPIELTAGTTAAAGVPTGPAAASLAPPVPAAAPRAVPLARQGIGHLMQLPGPQRAQELAQWLHHDRDTDQGWVEPRGLAECLRGVPGGSRAEIVSSYWSAREWVARAQVWAEQAARLDELATVALKRRQDPGSSAMMLRIQAWKAAALADEAESSLRAGETQGRLTALAGRPVAGPWVFPTSVPHGGGYALKYDRQPPEVAQRLVARRLVATVPLLHGGLQSRADAVVRADWIRADAGGRYERGEAALPATLRALRRETDETLGFLRATTRYNVALAEYALSVLPPDAPAEVLASALVLPGSGRSAGRM